MSSTRTKVFAVAAAALMLTAGAAMTGCRSSNSAAYSNVTSGTATTPDGKRGNLTLDEATDIALQNCENGVSVSVSNPSTFKGQDCWHIVVKSRSGTYYDCFIADGLCQINKPDDGGVSGTYASEATE